MKDLKRVFATLQAKYAAAYGVDDVSKAFSLDAALPLNGYFGENDEFEPSKEIMLNRESAEFGGFLGFVNIDPRQQKKGGTLRIGPQGRNTKTNDTKAGDKRRPGEMKPPVENLYEMHKAHFDFGIHDDDLSDLSEFPDWHDMYRAAMLEGMANDRLMIGWHGKEHVRTSDLTTHQMLEDVNIGWLELLRQRNSANVFTGDGNGEVKIGKNGHYANIDHFVQDLYQAIPQHRRTPGMTAVIGDALMGMAEGVYYKEVAGVPTEKTHIKEKAITGMYGGLDALPAHFFPQNGILITGLKRKGQRRSNLSIYYQRGSWKRMIKYRPEDERTTDWNARWEAFHIDYLDRMVFADLQKVIFLDVQDAAGNPVEIMPIPENKWGDM